MKKYLVMFMFCLLMASSNNAFASVATSTENLVEADGWMVKATQFVEDKETIIFCEFVNKTMGKKEKDGSMKYQSKHFCIVESTNGKINFNLKDVDLNKNVKLNIKRVIY